MIQATHVGSWKLYLTFVHKDSFPGSLVHNYVVASTYVFRREGIA